MKKAKKHRMFRGGLSAHLRRIAHSGLENLITKKTTNVRLSCGTKHYVDILNREGVTHHECDIQTDGQTSP